MSHSPIHSFKPVEIIQDKLYWISSDDLPRNQPDSFFFNIDEDLVYEPFFTDFGPLDLGKIYRFVVKLDKFIGDLRYSKSKFYHHTSEEPCKRANAALLMGAFQIISLKRTADEAWAPFSKVRPSLVAFRDASYMPCTYKCTILDCLRGLEYAIKLGWFNIETFNLQDYEFYGQMKNGDLTWIIPGKLIAFSSPSASQRDADGYIRFTPEDYIPIFKKFDVGTVVRLNNKSYEKERFIKQGIKHVDLYFMDGSCPSDEIISNFLNVCENEKGAVAVHCKAGLGRTGTLMATYAMKHYKFCPADFIGWIRLCRPGSILGPQQQFLIEKGPSLLKLADSSCIFKSIYPQVKDYWEIKTTVAENPKEKVTLIKKTVSMSPFSSKVKLFEDVGQAERLLNARFKNEIASENDSFEIPNEGSEVALPFKKENVFRGGKNSCKVKQELNLPSPNSPKCGFSYD